MLAKMVKTVKMEAKGELFGFCASHPAAFSALTESRVTTRLEMRAETPSLNSASSVRRRPQVHCDAGKWITSTHVLQDPAASRARKAVR